MDKIYDKFLEHGLAGAIAALFIYLYLQSQRELVAQSKAHTTQLLAMQREVLSAVAKLAELLDTIEKIAAERERAHSQPEPPRRIAR